MQETVKGSQPRTLIASFAQWLDSLLVESGMDQATHREADDDRREFLKKCGRFAVITPPAVTFLLSTSMSSKAIAASNGRPGNGFGDKNHDHSGPGGKAKKSSAKPKKH